MATVMARTDILLIRALCQTPGISSPLCLSQKNLGRRISPVDIFRGSDSWEERVQHA